MSQHSANICTNPTGWLSWLSSSRLQELWPHIYIYRMYSCFARTAAHAELEATVPGCFSGTGSSCALTRISLDGTWFNTCKNSSRPMWLLVPAAGLALLLQTVLSTEWRHLQSNSSLGLGHNAAQPVGAFACNTAVGYRQQDSSRLLPALGL